MLTGTAFVMTGVELEVAGTELAIAAEEDIRFVFFACVSTCEYADKSNLVCTFVYFFSLDYNKKMKSRNNNNEIQSKN